MVTRPRARGPDRKTTRLMRSLALLNSEDYQQRNRAFGRVLEICGDRVAQYVTRSLKTHAPKYIVHYAVFSDFDLHHKRITQDVLVFLFLHGGKFRHPDHRKFYHQFSKWLSATSAFKTKEHLSGLQRIARRFTPLDSEDDDNSDEEVERRPRLYYSVGRPHGVEDAAFGSDRLNTLMAAISRLPPHEQQLIILRYLYAYSYADLHKLTRKSFRALRTKLSRIRARLRVILQEMLESTD